MRTSVLIPIGLALAACNAADASSHGLVVAAVFAPEVAGTGHRQKEEILAGNCQSGCSMKDHPIPPFTAEEFAATLAAYAAAPRDEAGEALDTLVFYGRRTVELMDLYGTEPLPPEHVAFLRRQLRRNALVALRIVDEHGVVRAEYGPEPVPFGIKQHLHGRTEDLEPLEFNGTVVRVGLNTIWSRY